MTVSYLFNLDIYHDLITYCLSTYSDCCHFHHYIYIATNLHACMTGYAIASLLTCRQRDNEIASLRALLSERDESINGVMTELAEVHEQLRCQESSLQIAYNHLADASRDKARVRQQLLENQAVGCLSTMTCLLHCLQSEKKKVRTKEKKNNKKRQ